MRVSCIQCGKPESTRAGRKFCSPACYHLWRTGRHKLSRADRFWSKVSIGSADECWLWQAFVDEDGYGHFHDDSGPSWAHRVAWELGNGKTIPADTDVLHSCDVRQCCNYAHLHLGDQVVNNRERDSRDRFFRKVTLNTVREMRRMHAAGVAFPDLVAFSGLSDAQVSRIINYKQWVKPGDVE